MEQWLNKYQLKVVRKPGSGTEIEGSEEDYRRAIRAFIDENLNTKMIREVYETETNFKNRCEFLKKSSIGQLLNDDIVKQVMDCIMEVKNERISSLTENAYMGLIIHISIAINRILNHDTIDSQKQFFQRFQEDEDYLLASEIVKKLENNLNIIIPDIEVSYVCLHIKSAKHEKIHPGNTEIEELEGRKLQQLVNDMIDAFDKEKAYFLKQDDEFIQGLLAHLQPTLIRLSHNMGIQNPVLEDIKANYRDIYQKCLRVAEVLERTLDKKVPEEEVGFLTVHFGAALVRMEGEKEEIRQVQVGIVCSSGIGISRLMSSKIEKLFGTRMEITAYGKNDLTPYIIGKTDFFISSIPMESGDFPVIYVNPLLNDEDIEQIRKTLYKYERLPKNRKRRMSFSISWKRLT